MQRTASSVYISLLLIFFAQGPSEGSRASNLEISLDHNYYMTKDVQQSDWSIGFSNAVPERGDEGNRSSRDAKSLISICSILTKGPTYRNMRPITYAESLTPIRR
jgi:hypothetical protein